MIIKNNNSTFSLEISSSQMNKVLLNSIINTNLLNGIKTSFNKIDFYASSVKPLSLFFNEYNNDDNYYQLIIRIFNCLTTQYKYIEQNNYTFYSLSIDDIYVIDDWTFLCFNPKWLLPIDTNGNITFQFPFTKNELSSPELLSINKIPSSVNYKTFYYTLGALFYTFIKDKTSLEHKEDVLNTIYKTKLYWFIKRNTDTNIQNRNLLFI